MTYEVSSNGFAPVLIRSLMAAVASSMLLGCAGMSGGGAPSDQDPDFIAPISDDGVRPTFRVIGRSLYDRCGVRVVLRGVNEMIIWSEGRDGVPEFSEIAKTGANTVRIVWSSEGLASELDVAISNALANKLIPMVESVDATGNLSKVPEVVDYWLQPDVLAVLLKYEADLLLNIANEAGDVVWHDEFEETYTTAINRLRTAGLQLPLVIDAPFWGQDIDMLQSTGPDLIEADPLSNLLFSVHTWWFDPSGRRARRELSQSYSRGLPLIVGEFAQHAVSGCDESPFGYTRLLAEAERYGVGWLAWSWGGVSNDDCAGQGSFDMTKDGYFGNWETDWGLEVAVTDPNSIMNTSVRPNSIVLGSCEEMT